MNIPCITSEQNDPDRALPRLLRGFGINEFVLWPPGKRTMRNNNLRFLWLAGFSACLMVLFSCAPRWTCFPRESHPVPWERKPSIPDRGRLFKGKGSIQVRPAQGKAVSADFFCAASGDSLMRIDFKHPLGGVAASIRLRGEQYQLWVPSEKRLQEGRFTGVVLKPYVGTSVPLSLLRSVFTALPQFPDCPADSVCSQGSDTRISGTCRNRAWTIRIRNGNALSYETNGLLSGMQTKWTGFNEGLPYRVEIVSRKKAKAAVHFAKITLADFLSSSLFDWLAE